MYTDRIEYLKRVIKRTHKRYIGERTDGKATLLDVAKLFNIPIDEARMDDYSIKSIDYNTPSIEIVDRGNDTLYSSEYTGNADLLNYGGPMQFISVVASSPKRKEETLYYIGSNSPIITRMTFTDGEYNLEFEREMANSVGLFVNDGVKMAVRYVQNVIYNGNRVRQPLLNKIYKRNYKNNEISGTFEQTYTYGSNHFIKWKDTLDKYTYVKNNNVIYGVNEFEREGLCTYLRGICFEKTGPSQDDYFPLNMNAKDYPLISDDSTVSAMLFKFGTGEGVHNALEVYKGKTATNVIFNSKKYHYEEDAGSYEEPIVIARYTLPNLSEGTITSEEIDRIIESLQERVGDKVSLGAVSNELSTFKTKIDTRKGKIEEEVDPLSPRLFIDKSFDEIFTLVSERISDYFELISKEFMEAANISDVSENAKIKKKESPTE